MLSPTFAFLRFRFTLRYVPPGSLHLAPIAIADMDRHSCRTVPQQFPLPPVVSAAGDDYGNGNGCRTGCRTLYLCGQYSATNFQRDVLPDVSLIFRLTSMSA